MNSSELLRWSPAGVYCPRGEFFIDPCQAVDFAVITHAHGDHYRAGCRHYLTSRESAPLLRQRLGSRAHIRAVEEGEPIRLGDTTVSLHPAGHMLGSTQVRVERRGEVWCVTGDFQLASQPTCRPFEPVPCDVLVMESTFGEPHFVWPPAATEIDRLHDWWESNQHTNHTSLVLAYPFGKSQRILADLRAEVGPIWLHPATAEGTRRYAEAGIVFPPATEFCREHFDAWPSDAGRALVIAPPYVRTSGWPRKLGPHVMALASGWMLRPEGDERSAARSPDREGFVISDHADFPQLLEAVRLSGARRVLVMHGQIARFVSALRQRGIDAAPLNPHALIPALQRPRK